MKKSGIVKLVLVSTIGAAAYIYQSTAKASLQVDNRISGEHANSFNKNPEFTYGNKDTARHSGGSIWINNITYHGHYHRGGFGYSPFGVAA